MQIIIQRIAAIVITSLIICRVTAQQPVRAEIILPTQTNAFAVIPDGKTGALAYYINADPADKKNDDWVFIKYDTLLHKVWEKTFAIDKKKQYNGKTEFSDHTFYALYQTRSNPGYTLVCLDVVTGKIDEFTGAIDISLEKVNNGIAYFTSYPKGQCGLLVVNLKTHEKNYFTLDDYGKDFYLDYITVNESDSSLTACFNSGDKNPNIIIKTFSKEGKLTNTLSVLKLTDGKQMSKVFVTTIANGSKILTGTYSDPKGADLRGVFVAKYNGDTRQFLKFYNCLEFPGFFSYYSSEVKDELEGKPVNKKTLKREADVEYRLLMHDLIVRANDIVFIGEAHYSHRSTITFNNVTPPVSNQAAMAPNSAMNIAATTNYRIYGGEIFTHALVASFDFDGNKVWSNCFKIDENLTQMSLMYTWSNMEPTIAVNPDVKNIEMVCTTNDTIIAKTLTGNKLNNDRTITFSSIRTDNDKIKETVGPTVAYWYDRNFIFSGFQDMKASYKKEKKESTFYFLNKITY